MVSIGGVGGSGTRLIAQILRELGYYIGNDLNISNDNLLFTLIYKRQNILVSTETEFDSVTNLFCKIMGSDQELNTEELHLLDKLSSENRVLHTREWLKERVKNIRHGSSDTKWGWKEPNTHVVIERLFTRLDTLKFIYVYRNGMDMAYSSNQNQLRLWGNIFLNTESLIISPENSLKYWCEVHRRMLKLKEIYPDRILMFDFDTFCIRPDDFLPKLTKFIGTDSPDMNILKALIKKPGSIGRHKEHPVSDFDSADVDFVKAVYTSALDL